jgi:hypothetical protein
VSESRWERVIAGSAIGLAILIAAYTGGHMPSTWCATLDTVSPFNGFDRRFLVGALLTPFTGLFGYHYALFAAWSFTVLAAVLAVLARAAYRGDLARRLLIIAWLVFVGGFLFDEVGYFEQLEYLMLFGAVALVHRDRIGAAVAVMSLAPCVHELAILTVLPLFGLVLLRRRPFRQAAIATAIPMVVNLVLLAVPATPPSTIDRLMATLGHADFSPRVDALTLFHNSALGTGHVFDAHAAGTYVRPLMYVLVAAFAIAWSSDRAGWLGERDRRRPLLVLAASCAAIAIPSLLVFGGWDSNRWLFLVICNFCFVVWLTLSYRPTAPLRASTVIVLVVAMLVISRTKIYYFDWVPPRDVAYRPVRTFVREMLRGSAFGAP